MKYEDPRERYQRDPEFKQLVDMMTSFIHKAQFSPTELREASLLACCNYEMHRVSIHGFKVSEEFERALNKVHKIAKEEFESEKSD